MEKKGQSTVDLQEKEVAPYKHCLNCGTDLHGIYCHKCGQQASNPTSKVWEFILEYMNNAYIWDPKFFLTIWHLIRRPGHLTNEFNAGKLVAYEHPLKLNMFFLFVFVTLFLLFSDLQKADESFENLTKNELVRPILSLNAVNGNADYLIKMKESERDTIQLSIPLSIVKDYPEIITTIHAITDYEGERLDTLLVAIPQILIQDKILIREDEAVYSFSEENEIVDSLLELDTMSMIWCKMLDILTQYFPLIFLLTSPLLSFAVKLLHLRRKIPFISFFIFALHYTAFIEFMLLVIYLLYLTVQPGFEILQWIMILASCLYLTIAVKNVYENHSWIKSIAKAFFISLTYCLICFVAFLAIFFVTIFIVIIQNYH